MKFWFALVLCILCLSGCQINSDNKILDKITLEKQQVYSELSEIAKCYKDIYKQAYDDSTLNTLEVKQKIIDCLGKAGYSAVDTENQIDMVNPEQVERFCKMAEKQQDAEVIILLLMDNGSLACYDLKTKQGNVNVEINSLYWENKQEKMGEIEKFKAHTWMYSKKGYLFIEQYHKKGYDGPPAQVAIRVKPLEQKCRELNRKYVMPIGYERNNLLITDWSEEDYGEIEFYDLYEIMYYMKNGIYVPYDDSYGRTEYEIPKTEFEDVIKTYLKIDSNTIQNKTIYYKESQTYCYRSRGMDDAEFPYEPYPEVVAYKKQKDGTIKLTIDAVWTIKKKECALRSELVVCPLKNGGYQYVSNHVIHLQDSVNASWYTPRLTDKE